MRWVEVRSCDSESFTDTFGNLVVLEADSFADYFLKDGKHHRR